MGDDGQSPPGQECAEVRGVPLIGEIRTDSKKTFDELTETWKKIQETEQACNANRQSRQGRGMQRLVAAQRAMMAQYEKYKTAFMALEGKINTATPALRGLRDNSCHSQLALTKRSHGAQAQADMRAKIRASCDEGTLADRALNADDALTRGADGSTRAIRDVLLNPASNRELSNRLNEEAREWGRRHGLDPGGGQCGEKCVAILRAKRLYEQGGSSPEYLSAMAAARSTRIGLYGRSTLTRRR